MNNGNEKTSIADNDNKLIETIRAITELAGVSPGKQLLDEIANSSRALLNAAACILWKLDEQDDTLKVVAASGEMDVTAIGPVELDENKEAINCFLEQRSPLAYADIQQAHDHGCRKEAIRQKWLSLLTAPMFSRDRVVGLIDLYTHDKRRFSVMDKHIIATLAAQAALSIEQTRLADHIQEASRLALAGNYTDLADYIVKAVHDVTGLSVILWMMSDLPGEIGKILRIAALHGVQNNPGQYKKEATTSAIYGESITSVSLEEKEPIQKVDLFDVNQKPPFQNIEKAIEEGWRSFLSVPLLGQRGKPLGALSIYDTKSRLFGDAEKTMLSIFANQVATMFENIKLLEESDARRKNLERLVSIGDSVTIETARGYRAVLEKTVQGARELLGADHAVIYPVDPLRRRVYDLEHVMMDDHHGSSILELDLRDRGLVVFIREMDRLIAHDLDKGEMALGDFDPSIQKNMDQGTIEKIRKDRFIRAKGVKAFLGLTMKSVRADKDSEEQVGVLLIYFLRPHYFSAEERYLIRAFGHQIGGAIQAARLHYRDKQRLALLETLQNTVADLLAQRDPAKVVETIASSAAGWMRGKIDKKLDAAIWSVDHIQRNVKLEFGYLNDVVGATLPFGEDLAGKVAENRKPVITNNYMEWEGRSESYSKKIASSPVASKIGLPLCWDNRVIGVLVLYSPEPELFTTDDIELLEWFTEPAAIGLQNTRLYEALLSGTGSLLSMRRKGKAALKTISKNALDRLGADLLVIFEYHRGRDDEFPKEPVFVGYLNDPSLILRKMNEGSVVTRAVELKEAHYAGKAQSDSFILGKLESRKEAEEILTKEDRFVFLENIISSAIVPLRVDNDVVGIMFVNYRRSKEFTEVVKAEIELFAGQAALAIQTSKSFEQIATLHEIGKAMTEVRELDNLLEIIMDRTMDVAGFSRGFISLFNPRKNNLEVKALREPVEGAANLEGLGLGKGITGRVFETGKPILARDVSEYPIYEEVFEDTRSELCIPIRYRDKCTGILNIESHRLEAFDREDMELVSSIADQAAIAIENARYFQDAQKRIRDLETVNKVTEIISTKLATKDLLETIVERIAEELDCYDCTIFFPEKENNERMLVPFATYGYHSESIKKRRFGMNEGLASLVFENGESLMLKDARQHPRFVREKTPERVNTVRSMLTIPVKVGDKTIGVISADQNEPDWFSERGMQFVEALASQAGIAIERAIGLELLESVSKKIIGEHDVDDILEEIVSGAVKLTNASMGVIYLVNIEDKTVEKRFPQPLEFSKCIPPISGEGKIECRVFGHDEPMWIKDIRTGDKINTICSKHFCTLLYIPLKLEDKVYGGLCLKDKELRDFTEIERSLLTTLASQAAVAVENAKLYEIEKRHARELEAIYNVSLDIVRQPDVKRLLDTIVKQAAKLLDADGASLALHDAKTGRLRVSVAHKNDVIRGFEFELGQGLIGRVAKSKKAMFINNYHDWEGRDKRFDADKLTGLFNAVIAAPIQQENEVIGVLAVSDTRKERTFEQEDLKLLELITAAAAATIKNAKTVSFLDSLVSSSPNAIIAVDAKGSVTQFNEVCVKIMGFKIKEVIGASVTELYYEGEKEARKINKLLAERDEQGKHVVNLRTAVKGRLGNRIPIRLEAALLRNALGESIGSVGIMTDLTGIEAQQQEYKNQQDFLAMLELHPQNTAINSQEDLEEKITTLLEKVRDFCNTEYMIFFASLSENETVLQDVAHYGLPTRIEKMLPHFNWRKAGIMPVVGNGDDTLEKEAKLINGWRPDGEWREKMKKGIRGNNSKYFSNLACGIPVRLADNYRGVLVFGPFEENPDLFDMADFIKNIAQAITISALSWLQTLSLRRQNLDSQRSVTLLVHRARMFLQQIIGKFGLIKRNLEEGTASPQLAEEGEHLSLHFSKVIVRALTNKILEMEVEDFQFRSYSLAALVQNSVESFRERALSEEKILEVDPRVEMLPKAQIDPTILSVAVGNLIDNAIKYSFPNTRIKIFSKYDTREAVITVQNVGEKMDRKARKNLIEPGRRYVSSSRGYIPGTGFGLWDTNTIMKAHGGRIDFSSEALQSRKKRAYLVKVWITVPLRLQKK